MNYRIVRSSLPRQIGCTVPGTAVPETPLPFANKLQLSAKAEVGKVMPTLVKTVIFELTNHSLGMVKQL